MSIMPEPEMMMKKLSPAREVVCGKVEPEKGVKIISTEPRFKLKVGSVIPAKRRSVKRMMFDYVAKSIAAHVFRPRPPPSSSAVPQASNSTADSCFKKSKPIFPHHYSVAIP